jgi:hypothetical protein
MPLEDEQALLPSNKKNEKEEMDDLQKPPANSQVEEKLTDFAYRETCKVIRRGNKSRQWTKISGSNNNLSMHPSLAGPRSMGLIRVQPNMKKTPICTTFLRGITCTDKFCRKRHDVPKESAMPVCQFFQRHGQCLKGEECPFRHVKVNQRAMICPAFALLGFCEDKNCTMKHVHEQRTRPHPIPTTEDALFRQGG